MKKRACFYILNKQDDMNLSICKIIKKYYNDGHKILVKSDNVELMDNINDLLWTFEQLTFIPHSTNIEYDVTAPVLLYKNKDKNDSIIKKDYNVILNVDMELDSSDKEHEIIIEIVGHDESKRSISREKYLYYKKNKLDVRHENL
ncbi:MAG: DNA polymerase III subunit chi [Gammaproteobacteria bacterium]|nr:DNA polymerase III subunit chi [Gammaproteobacteria bacterium]